MAGAVCREGQVSGGLRKHRYGAGKHVGHFDARPPSCRHRASTGAIGEEARRPPEDLQLLSLHDRRRPLLPDPFLRPHPPQAGSAHPRLVTNAVLVPVEAVRVGLARGEVLADGDHRAGGVQVGWGRRYAEVGIAGVTRAARGRCWCGLLRCSGRPSRRLANGHRLIIIGLLGTTSTDGPQAGTLLAG